MNCDLTDFHSTIGSGLPASGLENFCRNCQIFQFVLPLGQKNLIVLDQKNTRICPSITTVRNMLGSGHGSSLFLTVLNEITPNLVFLLWIFFKIEVPYFG